MAVSKDKLERDEKCCLIDEKGMAIKIRVNVDYGIRADRINPSIIVITSSSSFTSISSSTIAAAEEEEEEEEGKVIHWDEKEVLFTITFHFSF